MSYATRYAALKRQQDDDRASTPEAEQNRRDLDDLFAEVAAERDVVFPDWRTLLVDDSDLVGRMIDWHNNRIETLRKERGI